jgi:phenylacetate-CoA ligase
MRNALSLVSWGCHARLRRDIARLESLYYEPYEKMREAKIAALRELVRHAMENVPFYRELYGKAGVVVDDLRTFDDLKYLPYVRKEDFRKVAIEDRSARNIASGRRWLKGTSGSTGEPFSFYVDRTEMPLETAAHNLSCLWSGWRPGERTAYVKYVFPNSSPLQGARQRVKEWMGMGTIRILVCDLTAATVPEAMERLVDAKVTLLQGYASSLCTLARQWKNARPSSIRSIISIAEDLSEDDGRVVSERLGGEVFRDYSLTECMRVGFECSRHDGYHIDPLRSIVETAKGYRGSDEIVLTNLQNWVHPFIRYRAGDIGGLTLDACPCGRRTPRIVNLGGRVLDVIVTPENKELSVHVIGSRFRDFEEAIDLWQVRQVSETELEVLIEAREDFNEDVSSGIRRQIEEDSRYTMKVRVRVVDSIPLGKNGKRDRIVSLARLRVMRGDPEEGGTPRTGEEGR